MGRYFLYRHHPLSPCDSAASPSPWRAGQLIGYTSLARSVQVSLDTIRRWIGTLERLFYCFAVRPWHRNVARARAENLVACALLKAVHFWTDHGFGTFGLHFVRDKQKREVDFLVSRDGAAWFLVEVKRSATAPLSPALGIFQAQIDAPHAFQLAIEADPVERDCFGLSRPTIVPARTFLAQLV